ncbi:lipopolysaccharide core heptose(I) kinase RfaP [Pseudohongiella spirulinae]|uniref:Lipopolysaccharide core heptose(I) kinase n=1 Tax=Pseudohongiella spirulinae TaxID=1249552 RepID=A0A0S2K9J2_9GAMM|nr:lipopolysaccharide core heptose(I) kinase RfaP [Pseudohongiella spirulinae]ALO44998.1 Lipopolysaccharide core heptose(I) kinase [Pseudohongiella spirulinae]
MSDHIELRQELADSWSGRDVFTVTDDLQGAVFRQAAGRRTMRFELNNRHYFIKIHKGVGWPEILKNVVSLRLPIVSARTEWQAIRQFERLGVPTMSIAGFGERGRNPARRESFLITDEIAPALSLEEFCADWHAQRPPLRYKRQLIRAVATIARQLHENGVCHRDFYLCHFLLRTNAEKKVDYQTSPELSVIDLHRVLIRRRLARRWIIKDLSGLYYSAMDCGLTQTDLACFMKYYTGQSWREAWARYHREWLKVQAKARRILKRDQSKALEQLARTLYRDGVDITRDQTFDRLAVYHSTDESVALRSFIDSPDRCMDQAQMIKDGDSTTVVRVTIGHLDCVVKRYNIKNAWYLLRRLFRPSRAWYCWRNAHWLESAGIKTPRPVLLLERRWGPLRREAYFVTTWENANDVLQLLKSSGESSSANWQQFDRLFKEMLLRLKRAQIIHGDMKASNFLYNGQQLTVLDLDAMRRERSDARFKKYFRRDVLRFLANWPDERPGLQRIRKLLG